jgi:hypothetical protein
MFYFLKIKAMKKALVLFLLSLVSFFSLAQEDISLDFNNLLDDSSTTAPTTNDVKANYNLLKQVL